MKVNNFKLKMNFSLVSLYSFAVILGVIYSSSVVQIKAQSVNETKRYIKKIQLKDVSQLTSMIKASGIKAELKVEALNRIESLIRKNPKKGYKIGKKIIKDVETALKKHQKDTQTNFYYKIRQAACDLMGSLNGYAIAATSISGIRKLFLSDSSHKVQISCGRALGEFKEAPELASKVLLEKLNSILKQEEGKIKSDYKLTVKAIVIIRSIGKLSSKTSFLPLMRVLQSGFSIPIKKEAEEAIEKIKW